MARRRSHAMMVSCIATKLTVFIVTASKVYVTMPLKNVEKCLPIRGVLKRTLLASKNRNVNGAVIQVRPEILCAPFFQTEIFRASDADCDRSAVARTSSYPTVDYQLIDYSFVIMILTE